MQYQMVYWRGTNAIKDITGSTEKIEIQMVN